MKNLLFILLVSAVLLYACKKEAAPVERENVKIEIACPVQQCLVTMDTTSKYGSGKLDQGQYQRRMRKYYAEKNDHLHIYIDPADLQSIIPISVKVTYKGNVIEDFNGNTSNYTWSDAFAY